MGCVYQARNILTGKCYVGKISKTLEERKKEHGQQSNTKNRIFFYSEDHKKKISAGNKGIIVSPEKRERITEGSRKYHALRMKKVAGSEKNA